jgi:hypothetical protein
VTPAQQEDTDVFYALLDDLSDRIGGPRKLKDCTASSGWPRRGVYFFFEEVESRVNGNPRVVRVGTHAITNTSNTTLWNRLSNHRGNIGGANPGGGNHRGSIFREHVGTALLRRGNWPSELHQSWRDKNAFQLAREWEYSLEQAVSRHIGDMPFLWLEVPELGDRQVMERNSIGLLSRRRGGVDAESRQWLGLNADSEKVCSSALWNVMHVDGDYDPNYLNMLERLIKGVAKSDSV